MIHFNKVGVKDWDVINEMIDQVWRMFKKTANKIVNT